VIDGQALGSPPAVLAAVAIATQNLSLAETNPRARTMDHVDEADDRGTLVGARDCADDAPAILQHHSLAGQNQIDGPPRITDVERFVIPVEH
jgi:hypothetical protein